jgi:hypothetical protein
VVVLAAEVTLFPISELNQQAMHAMMKDLATGDKQERIYKYFAEDEMGNLYNATITRFDGGIELSLIPSFGMKGPIKFTLYEITEDD